MRRCRVCGAEFPDPFRRLLISQIIFWIGAFFIGIILAVEMLQKMPSKYQQLGMLGFLIGFPIIAIFFLGRIVFFGRRYLEKSAPYSEDSFEKKDRSKEDQVKKW